MENCNFVNTSSAQHGGALCIADESNWGSSTVASKLINCNFINITSRWFAIYIHGNFSSSFGYIDEPEIIDGCYFLNCTGTGEYSGAIGISHDNLIVKNSEFVNCSGGQGAAIMVGGLDGDHDGFSGRNYKGNNVTLENCIFTDQATASSEKGPNMPKTQTNPIDAAFGDDYLDVFPFWASGVKLTKFEQGQTQADVSTKRNQTGTVVLRDDIMDWNTSYSSQLVLVATCANYNSLAQSQQAKYAALGTMTAQGSFTIFRVAGDIDPNLIRACRHCTIQMGTAKAPAEKAKIKFGSVVFSSGSTDVQTGSSFIQSSFSFTALGNGQDPIMKLQAPTVSA